MLTSFSTALAVSGFLVGSCTSVCVCVCNRLHWVLYRVTVACSPESNVGCAALIGQLLGLGDTARKRGGNKKVLGWPKQFAQSRRAKLGWFGYMSTHHMDRFSSTRPAKQ